MFSISSALVETESFSEKALPRLGETGELEDKIAKIQFLKNETLLCDDGWSVGT